MIATMPARRHSSPYSSSESLHPNRLAGTKRSHVWINFVSESIPKEDLIVSTYNHGNIPDVNFVVLVHFKDHFRRPITVLYYAMASFAISKTCFA